MYMFLRRWRYEATPEVMNMGMYMCESIAKNHAIKRRIYRIVRLSEHSSSEYGRNFVYQSDSLRFKYIQINLFKKIHSSIVNLKNARKVLAVLRQTLKRKSKRIKIIAKVDNIRDDIPNSIIDRKWTLHCHSKRLTFVDKIGR